MRYRYVAIEREYGSGGTEIARKLAEECGIPCYGREILETVAKEHQVSSETLEAYEECATNSFLYSIYLMSQVPMGETNLNSREGNLYLAEQRCIRRYAGEGPAVFLGHCAAAALRDKESVLKVFIGADMEFRKQRSCQEYHLTEKQAEENIRRFDKKRSVYFEANTARKWRDNTCYDLILNSGMLGIDGCVAALKGILLL